MTPRVEFLWWEGCPSHERALDELRGAMRELDIDPASVEVRHVGTEEESAREGFPGSPTVRIDGEDVQPPEDEPGGLSCRVYRLRDGRISPTPDPADVREALLRATKAG